MVATGTAIDRPLPPDNKTSDKLTAWQKRVEALVGRLTANIPIDITERSSEQQARWILAHTLDWHRREAKTVWWEYFRRSRMSWLYHRMVPSVTITVAVAAAR